MYFLVGIQDTRAEAVVSTMILLNQGKMPPEVLPFLNSAGAPDWNPGLILTDDFSPFDILEGSG